MDGLDGLDGPCLCELDGMHGAPSMLSFDAIWMDWMDPASADWIDWMALPQCNLDGLDGLDGPCLCGPDGLGGAPSMLLE